MSTSLVPAEHYELPIVVNFRETILHYYSWGVIWKLVYLNGQLVVNEPEAAHDFTMLELHAIYGEKSRFDALGEYVRIIVKS